jgi:superfamily II DNA/RNA helicase
MWSATWPREVEELATSYCNNLPVHVQVGSNEISANAKIKQIIEIIDENNKYQL